MRTQETRLLADALELAIERPSKHAVVLDLSGILHVDDSVFRRTLTRWLRGDSARSLASGLTEPAASLPDSSLQNLGQQSSGLQKGPPGIMAYELAHGRLALVIDDAKLPAWRELMSKVAGLLAEHRRGRIEATWFDLSRKGDAFAAAARSLAETADLGSTPDYLPREEELGRFLAIERTLHSADIASLQRQQRIFHFDAGVAAGGADPPPRQIEDAHPTLIGRPVLVEVTVALSELERMFGVPVARDPWLYDRVTELLDRRMLYHLARERLVPKYPQAIKLHGGTVLDPAFPRLMEQFTAQHHGRLVIELPHLEWQRDADMINAAIKVVRIHGVPVALDHVPMAALLQGGLPDVDYLRIPWIEDDGDLANLAGSRQMLARMGVERCILARCHQKEAVTAGLDAGFRLLQGSAVDRFVAEDIKRGVQLNAQKRNAEALQQPVAGSPGAPAEPGAQVEEGTVSKKPQGWLGKLLNRS